MQENIRLPYLAFVEKRVDCELLKYLTGYMGLTASVGKALTTKKCYNRNNGYKLNKFWRKNFGKC